MENLAKELERGRVFANQLRRVIFKSNNGEEEDEALTTSSAEDLVAKVVDSFTNTLSLFNSQHSLVSADSMTTSHLPANSDESQGSCKSRSPTIKDRRSSPKKRKSTHTWEVDSKISPTEDGHAWRKYGQKIIHNAKYPRNYYRCTHKFEQGCRATKHVQRIQEDPPLYRTTYFDHHTCTNFLNPHIFLDSHDLPTSTCFLSFDNNNNNLNNNNNNNTTFLIQPSHLFSSSSSSSFPNHVKNEEDKEDKCCNNDMIKQDHKNNHNVINVPSSPYSSNDEYFVSLDHYHHHQEVVLPSESDHDHVDNVISSASVFWDPIPDLDLDALVFDPLEF